MVPECAPYAQREWRRREVVLLVEGPVPGGEGARHHQLLQGRKEEEAPQQHEQVEQLGKNLEIIRWHPFRWSKWILSKEDGNNFLVTYDLDYVRAYR